jgi:hypothetical protein
VPGTDHDRVTLVSGVSKYKPAGLGIYCWVLPNGNCIHRAVTGRRNSSCVRVSVRGVAASPRGRSMFIVSRDALYTVPVFAREVARVHPVTVYQAIARQKSYPIPRFVRVGRTVRFRGSDILEWLANLPTNLNLPCLEDLPSNRNTQLKSEFGRPTKARQVSKRLTVSNGRISDQGGAS